jgi:hypothetical protein
VVQQQNGVGRGGHGQVLGPVGGQIEVGDGDEGARDGVTILHAVLHRRRADVGADLQADPGGTETEKAPAVGEYWVWEIDWYSPLSSVTSPSSGVPSDPVRMPLNVTVGRSTAMSVAGAGMLTPGRRTCPRPGAAVAAVRTALVSARVGRTT